MTFTISLIIIYYADYVETLSSVITTLKEKATINGITEQVSTKTFATTNQTILMESRIALCSEWNRMVVGMTFHAIIEVQVISSASFNDQIVKK